jgi:hypothetical protein
MKTSKGIQQLSEQALKLKKTWILAVLMVGHIPKGNEATIPDYSKWGKLELKAHLAILESDIVGTFKSTLVSPRKGIRFESVTWFATQFDRWQQAGLGLFVLSTALEFENTVGKLLARSLMDIPPYAELLIQPGTELAFRHPEYMLVRDLECVYGLYRDTERLLSTVNWSSPPEWGAAASENAQALGRTTILSCFNLLESYISGLGRAYVMYHPELDEAKKNKLHSTKENFRRRIISVPRQILGHEPTIDPNSPPLSDLLDLKKYRDSFVHCEPGDQISEHGYVKEKMFHNISPELVDKVILTTETVIRKIWKDIYVVDGPRWLPLQGILNQTWRVNLTVAPPKTRSRKTREAL